MPVLEKSFHLCQTLQMPWCHQPDQRLHSRRLFQVLENRKQHLLLTGMGTPCHKEGVALGQIQPGAVCFLGLLRHTVCLLIIFGIAGHPGFCGLCSEADKPFGIPGLDYSYHGEAGQYLGHEASYLLIAPKRAFRHSAVQQDKLYARSFSLEQQSRPKFCFQADINGGPDSLYCPVNYASQVERRINA